MRVILNKENYRISTKEELIELLEKYKGIMNKSIVDYLNSLINLEFSVIRDYISEKDRTVLSELEIYKKAAMYNIYNRALNIFKEAESELIISGNNNGMEGLAVSAPFGKKVNCKLFDYNYREGPIGYKSTIPKGYKTMNIGSISLYKEIEDENLRKEELERIMNVLEELYKEENPYHDFSNVYGGPASQWNFRHNQKIRIHEAEFKELDSRKSLTEEDRKEIEITKKYYDLFLEDYGLKEEEFVEEINQTFFSEDKLHKTLVKKMPNIDIKNNIKYI